MLVIRMQRTGRKGHAQFRVVVQDSRRTPTSGKIVAHLGHFNPHSKQTVLDKEKIQFYLDHGAQPSDRAARLLKAEGIKLPAWVKLSSEKQRTVRNPDKRRSTRPAEPEASEPAAEESTAGESQGAQETSSTETATEPEGVQTSEEPTEQPAEPGTEATAETAGENESVTSEPAENENSEPDTAPVADEQK